MSLIGVMSAVVSDSTPPTAGSQPCLLVDRADSSSRHFFSEEERKSARTGGGGGEARAMDTAAVLLLPSHRDQRSSSDAFVHAVSRSRAAAAAAVARSRVTDGHSNGCPLLHPLLPLQQRGSPQLPRSSSSHGHRYHQHQHQHPHQHHEHCEVHHSQCSIGGRSGGAGSTSLLNTHLPITSPARRSHSQSSLARLAVKHPSTPDNHPQHSGSTSSLSRSLLHKRPEEEVTYVWREGRVQIQQPPAARNGHGGGSCGGGGSGYQYSEHRKAPGQHVEYLWQGGNVQKVIRGANNETLATEVVPPRGSIKGLNLCVILCPLILMVSVIIALLFVFKVIH